MVDRAVILVRNGEHCGINSGIGSNMNFGIRQNSRMGWNRSRMEFLGIPSDSGITISNIILSWLLHLVMIQFLTGIGLCSDGITFKHITMHEGEGRRVIPVRNSGIGTHSMNSGIGRNSREFRAIPRNSEIGGIPGIDATRNRTEL